MNTLTKSLFAAILLVTMSCSLKAADAVIAVSPALSVEDREDLQRRLLLYFLQEAEPEDRFLILNGMTGNIEAEVEIPQLKIDTARTRQRAMRETLDPLLRFFKKPMSGALSGTGTLNTHKVVSAMERLRVSSLLLIGSPIHRDLRNPSQSWYQEDGTEKGYWFPSDGVFFTELGGSPWSVAAGRQRLSGIDVHWLIKGDMSDQGDSYIEKLKRFYGLYIGLEEGRLVSFLDDPAQALRDLFRRDLMPYSYELDGSQKSVEMRRTESAMLFNDEAVEHGMVAIPEKLTAKPISRICVVDVTSSMGNAYSKVARRIAMMPDGQNTLLITFSDHTEVRVVTVFEESDQVSEIARALRSIDLVAGGDEPEALGDALKVAGEELEARNVSSSSEIWIWTDAPPKAAKNTPTGVDCVAEMQELLSEGHRITMVKCHKKQNLDWLPYGVKIGKL